MKDNTKGDNSPIQKGLFNYFLIKKNNKQTKKTRGIKTK